MRGQRVELSGINRLVGSADNDVGCCSELINLTPRTGMKVVGKKDVVSANIPYSRIRLHRIGTIVNYIGIQSDANGVKVVHFEPKSGIDLQIIKLFPVGSEIYFTFLNNQLVISDRTAIKEYVYQFDSTYKLAFEGFNLDLNPGIEPFMYLNTSDDIYIKAPSKADFLASCRAKINEFEIENKNYCEGTFLYAFTITLKDGTETGMYGLKAVSTQYTSYPDSSNAFINTFVQAAHEETIRTRFNWHSFYQKSVMKFGEMSELFNRYEKLISKVNLYVSMPVSRFDIVESEVTMDADWVNNKVAVYQQGTKLNAKYANLSNPEKSLLYRQKSWAFDEFCKGVEYTFEFGGDIQATGATMEVSSSELERAGNMYTYNNRVHFYDSRVRLDLKLSSLSYGRLDPASYNQTPSITESATAIVYVRVPNKDIVFKYDGLYVELDNNNNIILPEMFVYPDSRAYKMDVIANGKIISVDLSPSPSYNYAYYHGGWHRAIEPVTDFDGVYPELSDTYDETDIVNVTASGTPMVFPVEHSYRFDGNITALAVSTSDISDAQVGQWPVNVFTDNGIFALQQGSGAVLYSNIVAVSKDVCLNANIINTRQGIAFIANGAVYILYGRNAKKLSVILEGEPDIYIQDNTSFVKCCGSGLYDITQYLSQVNFKEYVKDAKLSWCADTNELIVSNRNYPYSYVYDFVFNAWHKETGIFEAIGDNLVLRPGSLNNTNAVAATNIITLDAIHIEQSKVFSSVCNVSFNQQLSCAAGHTIALIVNGTQIASATFRQVTKMNMIVATLCQNIGYLEDYKGNIYSNIDLVSQVVKIYNITTGNTMQSATFVAAAQAVTIPDKAINATIGIKIAGKEYSTSLTSADTVITTLSNLTQAINDTDVNVSATMNRNSITLTAKTPGAAANKIKIEAYSTDPDYIYISSSANTMTGGMDISLQPSSYNEMIDWSNEKLSEQQLVHLHTRPLHLADKNTYKTIKKAILNCLAQLSGTSNLSLYIYASNNLTKWKCVCAAQRINCDIAQITTDRASKAYKYFIFMIGGIVSAKTQISDIILSIDDIANSKIR